MARITFLYRFEGQSNAGPGTSDDATATDTNAPRSRREIMWQGFVGNNITLDGISCQFKNTLFKSSLSLTPFSLKHVAHDHRVVHWCQGHRREEVTLRPALSDCNVITHTTPSLHEKCPIRRKDVEEEVFEDMADRRVKPPQPAKLYCRTRNRQRLGLDTM